jgi:hypothetical protein
VSQPRNSWSINVSCISVDGVEMVNEEQLLDLLGWDPLPGNDGRRCSPFPQEREVFHDGSHYLPLEEVRDRVWLRRTQPRLRAGSPGWSPHDQPYQLASNDPQILVGLVIDAAVDSIGDQEDSIGDLDSEYARGMVAALGAMLHFDEMAAADLLKIMVDKE